MDDARWLAEDEQRAWRAWLELNTQLSARLNRDLQVDRGLSLADYEVLVALTDTPARSLRMYELGHRVQWEKSRLSKQVTRMAARGLVERRECSDDRRGAFVDLTEDGLRAIRAAAPEHVALVRELVFDALTPAEVGTLGDIMSKLLARVSGPTAVPA